MQLELAEERGAWNAYYDAIEQLEDGDGQLASRARTILDECRVESR